MDIQWHALGTLCHRTVCRLRVRRALMLVQRCSALNQKGAISLYKVNGDSALLVLNRTSSNNINALLALSWRVVLGLHILHELLTKVPRKSSCDKVWTFWNYCHEQAWAHNASPWMILALAYQNARQCATALPPKKKKKN